MQVCSSPLQTAPFAPVFQRPRAETVPAAGPKSGGWRAGLFRSCEKSCQGLLLIDPERFPAFRFNAPYTLFSRFPISFLNGIPGAAAPGILNFRCPRTGNFFVRKNAAQCKRSDLFCAEDSSIKLAMTAGVSSGRAFVLDTTGAVRRTTLGKRL
jgi:hypothetical protein